MRRFAALWLAAVVVATISGCGYTTHSQINERYKTIYIEPFVNKVDIAHETSSGNKYKLYRPSLETDVSQHVSNKFLFDGNLKPATKESADLVLKGELVELRRDPLRYDNSDNVTEYRLSICVNIALWDKRENKMLFEENNFVGYTTYFISGSLAKTDDAAVNDALEDLSRRIVERVVEQW
ncbi:MAG: LPS assembly lipoprotein LptE [Candidatus Omnitrophica bacterium]|nr:LPS assembly lipoprotein LptE [Candidatus Omnitrophota bacterium]